MKPPLTFYSYQVPFTKKLEDIISLFCLRVCLFFFATSLRYPGPSIAIALLLFLTATSGHPTEASHTQLSPVLGLGCRLLSILLGLMWMSLSTCRLLIQVTKPQTWKQEMQHSEDCLRYRISALEDWLVLPRQTHQRCGEVIEVRYQQPKKV
jgi:hypothetical protein